jgi:glycerophosphoryl diester phosphodiesterase
VTDAGGGPPAAHPDSLLVRPDGSRAWLKVHRCVWSGQLAANSLDAVRECHGARVAHAEVDLWLLGDADGIIDHDGLLHGAGRRPLRARHMRRRDVLGIAVETRPALLSELVDVVRDESYPTRIEIDIKDELPWSSERVDEILGCLDPIRERVTLAGCNDETLRRLAAADGRMSIGFNPAFHLDWLPLHRRDELAGAAGPDGWLDRTGAQTLPARLAALRSLVPTAEELHLRLEALERLMIEGVTDTVGQMHAYGWAVDVWTLDEGMIRWQARMHAAVAAGVDMITTTSAPVLARAFRDGPPQRSAWPHTGRPEAEW